jgi:hypothetical protein
LQIIDHFHLLGCSIPKEIEKVVGLKHMTQEALIIQNGCENIHGFDEINENVVVILDGEIMGILLHDSMSIEEANEYENHLWFLYEHGGNIKKDNIFSNSKMKMFGHRDC